MSAQPLTHVRARTACLPDSNIDTDRIIPARFLTTTSREGLGRFAFNDWRYREDGSPDPAFALNAPDAQGAQILVAGRNFGCGSSREHAPWALTGWGLRAIISTGFADIFKSNALKNGLLPVVVSKEAAQKLFAAVAKDRAARITIDLPSQTVTLPDGSTTTFPIDDFAKHCLLNGIDQLGYLQSFDAEITKYEQRV